VDERSFASTARVNNEGPMRRFIRRHGLKVSVVLFIAALWVYGLLPLAVRGQGGRLWSWGGYRFGLEREVLRNGAEARLWWWAGGLWRVEVDNRARLVPTPEEPSPPEPGLAWEMWRTREGVYHLKVYEPGASFRDLNSSFNEMKRPGMFGILLDDPARTVNVRPFEVSGTRTELMSKIITEFACNPGVFLLRPDQPFVWVYDPGEERLYPLRTGAARLAGIPMRPSGVMGLERTFIHPQDEGLGSPSPESAPEHWMPDAGVPGSEKAKR